MIICRAQMAIPCFARRLTEATSVPEENADAIVPKGAHPAGAGEMGILEHEGRKAPEQIPRNEADTWQAFVQVGAQLVRRTFNVGEHFAGPASMTAAGWINDR